MLKKHEIYQKSVWDYLHLLKDHKDFLPILLHISSTFKYVSSLPEVEKITTIFLPFILSEELKMILSSSSHC